MWGMYWAPDGFCFDTNCADPSLVTNKASPEYNVLERVEVLVEYLSEQVWDYRVTPYLDFKIVNRNQCCENVWITISLPTSAGVTLS